jgi:hypothetical protein
MAAQRAGRDAIRTFGSTLPHGPGRSYNYGNRLHVATDDRESLRNVRARMSTETAQAVLIAGIVIGGIAWLAGLWFLFASSRQGRSAREQVQDHLGTTNGLPAHWVFGSAEVEGPVKTLMDRLSAFLPQVSSGALQITEQTSDQLAFEQSGPGLPMHLQTWVRAGRVWFSSQGGSSTRIDYAVEVPAGRWLMRMGVLFQVLGLLALVGIGWTIYTYCATSPDPELRVQTIQIIHVAHFVWPPFLFGGLYRQRRRVAREQFDLLLKNLPKFAG